MHLVCNSKLGIQVDKGNAAPNFCTRISGFAQSCGSIQLDPRARVDDGVRPQASAEALPKFDIRGEFDPKGQPGTIEIVELQQPAQEIDCIYRSGHDLSFNGPVKMYDSYLYVQGNLKIQGGISGTGATVVDGDLEVTGSIDRFRQGKIPPEAYTLIYWPETRLSDKDRTGMWKSMAFAPLPWMRFGAL